MIMRDFHFSIDRGGTFTDVFAEASSAHSDKHSRARD